MTLCRLNFSFASRMAAAQIGLCDQLEASLTTGITTRLLEFFLHEALGNKLEAA